MTIKSFYLVGQDKATYGQDIHVEQYHDLEALQAAVASQYNIIDTNGVGLQDPKGEPLDDLDAVLDCDDEIGVTVDGQAIRDPTGPQGIPIAGSYYEVFPDHLGNHARLFQTYGPLIKYSTMGKENYLTNDPAIAAVAFQEGHWFSKKITGNHPLAGIKDNRALFIGDTDTEAWRQAHKFIPPSMSPRAVRHYTPLMEASVKDSFSVFDKLDEDNEAWNVYQYMLKLASQTVFKFALGYDAHHFDSPDSPLNELVVLIAQSLSLNKKVTSRGSWYQALGFVPYTAPNELRQIQTRLWTILNKAIDEAPKGDSEDDLELQTAALGASCVVDYLKRATDDKGNKLPRDLVIPNMLPISGAGFTTTSALLSWLIYSLCVYEGNQDRLLQELVDAGVSEKTKWTPELSDGLTFLDKFVKETQRLHNPSFQPGRTALVDCIVPGGYKLPAGAVVICALHAIHNNPKIWSNPDRFDPDRWGSDEVKNRPKNSYIPFAIGPRSCIGFNFALGEVKVLLPELVYRYEFSKEGDEAVTYDPEFQLIRPMNFYVRARKRTSWPKPSPDARKIAEDHE
ncbi:Isotrichodermin C-15 hydroxylase [Elsinoe australis]|uniref:Isotrichodermin C-15 hydroxylase n=1 Tax=Elsinoe australis TaxID=40998 RepID=A0A2P7Z498_9PEZI|nr:Isotrichodermin C-15 hydroxylase [Elsinoe australis]